MPREMIMLKGDHNVANVLAACAIAHAAGISPEAMVNGIAGFIGVPHRLELVRILHGTAWYNDSIATAPERTMAALRSFQEPVVLLLGGRDKNLPWDELVELVRERARHIALFGEAATMIKRKLETHRDIPEPYTLSVNSTLQEAILSAQKAAKPGDVVLLSPGCTSYDAFIDFEERGEKFRQWVNTLT
jgi:UDP-N-acetylmuramoylalanine--D-glutamate ligase